MHDAAEHHPDRGVGEPVDAFLERLEKRPETLKSNEPAGNSVKLQHFAETIVDQREEIAQLKSRTCEHCKHWGSGYPSEVPQNTCIVLAWGISVGDDTGVHVDTPEIETPKDFGCNKWETK